LSASSFRVAGALVAVVLVAIGVWTVRDATMSEHTFQDPGSRLEVVVESRTNGSEPGQLLAEYTRAKVRFCRTEVAHSDLAGELEAAGAPGRFRFVLRPTLDDSDRRQFRGCMEDWNLDHVQVDVVSMMDLAPAPAH
jgi:hypothetical protein